MMPVKEILGSRHLKPRPPVLVIDETTIRCSDDAGPICGCDEKYSFVQNFKPFVLGGVNPYRRREIPDGESLEIYWKPLKIGTCDLIFEKPFAVHRDELPENVELPRETPEEEMMFIRQHKYTQSYVIEKLKQCEREHPENCSCPGK